MTTPRQPPVRKKAAPARKATAARKPPAGKKAAPARKKAAPARKKAVPARKATAARPPRPAMDERIRQRRQAVQLQEQRRRRRVVTSVLVLALLIGGGFGVSRTPLFAVGEVRLEGVSDDRHDEVIDAAGVAVGTNVLDVDTQAVALRIEALPWVRSANVRRAPAALEIVVVAREPAAVVRLSAAAWVVDSEGWVLGGGAPAGLVQIEAPQAVMAPVGERISDVGVRNALAMHAALPEDVRSLVDRYDAPSDRGLRLHLGAHAAEGKPAPPGVWVRVGLAERVEAKAKVILLLLDQARRQAQEAGQSVDEGELPPGIAELDVRAPDNPVLIPHS